MTANYLPSREFLKYFLITAITLVVFGLAAFYLILNKEKKTITENDVARGYTPSFETTPKAGTSTVSSVNTTENSDRAEETTPKTPQRLWQVSKSPIAGIGFVGNATSSTFNFAERSSGYIFAAEPKAGSVVRLSNRLLPKIYEAFFDETGGIILRSANQNGTITTFSGVMSASSTLSGKYLDNDINTLSINSKTGELFSLRSNLTGGTVGTISARDGTKQKIAFSSTLSNWAAAFLSDGRIFLTQKASDNVAGYAYELKGGALVPIVRDIPGLIFLPKPKSSAALFSGSQAGTIQLYALVDSSRVTLPLKTVADKCVWSSNPEGSKELIAYCAVPQIIATRNFLETRYQGRAYTSDDWWRVNAADGTVDFLYSPEGASLDVENPIIDEKDETIAFINRSDKTLWGFRRGEKAVGS